jgi:hypothetical protein
MRCSRCGSPETSSLRGERGLRFAIRISSLILTVLALGGAFSFAAPDTCAREDPPLVRLAAVNFPTLTRAERALLEFAERSSINRGSFAIAGSSDAPLDPSNDPAHADEWTHDRDVRADLIRWPAVDNGAISLVDPKGVRLLGARIIGPVDLSHIKVPFAITLVRCSIPQRMYLESADLPYFDLSGSYTGRIDAPNLTVHGNLNLSSVGPRFGERWSIQRVGDRFSLTRRLEVRPISAVDIFTMLKRTPTNLRSRLGWLFT